MDWLVPEHGVCYSVARPLKPSPMLCSSGLVACFCTRLGTEADMGLKRIASKVRCSNEDDQCSREIQEVESNITELQIVEASY